MSRSKDTRPEHEKLADAIRKIEDMLADAEPQERAALIVKAHRMDKRRLRMLAAIRGE